MSALGKKLISLVIRHKKFETLISAGINEEYFLSGVENTYKYLTKLVESECRYPSELEIADKFGWKLEDGVEEEIVYLIDLVKKRYISNKVLPHLKGGISKIEDRDPEAAIEEIEKALEYRRLLYADEHKFVHSFVLDASLRVEQYRKRKADGFNGLKTPWSTFNDVTGGGALDGIFHVFLGFRSAGKTWLLCVLADYFASIIPENECVIVISTEMAAERLAKRIDCIKYKLPFEQYRDGEMSDDEIKAWEDSIKKDERKCGDILFFDKRSVKTVKDVLNLAYQFSPRAILIDGAYRLEVEDKSEWSRQVAIIEAIQEAVIRTNIPWFCTSQLGDSSETGKGLEKRKVNQWNVRYAKEWTINPDIVITMQADEDLITLNQMEISFSKFRDGTGKKVSFRINWDREKMDFSEIIDTVSVTTVTPEESSEVEYA